MRPMVCGMILLCLVFTTNSSFAAEQEYLFPKQNPIFSLSIPSEWDVVSSMFPNSWREWKKGDVQGNGAVPFQASPDFVEQGRLLITLWAFVPDAVADLEAARQGASELISDRITDFSPEAETWSKTTVNGIPFVTIKGSGKEKAKNNEPVMVTAAFFNPEGTHVFLFMVTGSPDVLKKYEGEVNKIMNSIKTGQRNSR